MQDQKRVHKYGSHQANSSAFCILQLVGTTEKLHILHTANHPLSVVALQSSIYLPVCGGCKSAVNIQAKDHFGDFAIACHFSCSIMLAIMCVLQSPANQVSNAYTSLSSWQRRIAIIMWCNNIEGSFTCTCPMGYTGDVCDTDVNECMTEILCQNGET